MTVITIAVMMSVILSPLAAKLQQALSSHMPCVLRVLCLAPARLLGMATLVDENKTPPYFENSGVSQNEFRFRRVESQNIASERDCRNN